MISTPAKNAIIFGKEHGENNAMKTKMPEMPKFKTESEEADWWSSAAGRKYVKEKTVEAQSKGMKVRGSGLVAKMNQKSSEQISLRLPQADLARARELAERKGLGYQTLLKMLVHEGLAREARRG
jgi:predicted DNA binding CopG/RHH family protein